MPEMDYNKINKVDVDGNGNIVLQDLNGSDITVNYNDTAEFSKLLTFANEQILSEITKKITELNNQVSTDFDSILKQYFDLPPEVKQDKKEILEEILKLKQICIERKETLQQENAEQAKSELSRSEISKYRNLLKALERKSCILFVGPEISVDDENNSIHEKFYQELCENSEDGELEYDPKTGFFQPHKDPWFNGDVTDFYSGEFNEQNRIGQEVVKKMVSLPFKLIISLAPDNTVKNIFEKYDLQHEFLFYDKTELPGVKPTDEKPVVLNILGSAESSESEWKYIFTYKDFYEFVKNVKIPPEIENEVKNAIHYIFIGFDFDKFYNTLLLFILKLNQEEDIRKFKHVIEPEKLDNNVNTLLKKEFNISLIEKNYTEFANQITLLAKENDMYVNLEEKFLEKQMFLLKELEDELIDVKTKADTKQVNEKLAEINKKF